MRITYLILLVPLVMAGKCAPLNVTVQESCDVLRATLYADGKFALNAAEISGLRRENQVKIVAVKDYYRDNCVRKK